LPLEPHEVTPPPAPALCNSCWFEWHEGGAAVELDGAGSDDSGGDNDSPTPALALWKALSKSSAPRNISPRRACMPPYLGDTVNDFHTYKDKLP
jgi:hypothetical protein